jgi:uncharacterized protein (DUF2147 family)
MRKTWTGSVQRWVMVALLGCGVTLTMTTVTANDAPAADNSSPPQANAPMPATHPPSDEQAQEALGNWLTQGRDGIIQISQAPDGSYQGRIVGGGDPSRLDTTNPDPAKRHEPLLGQVIMQGMEYLGGGRFSTGTIRDPNNGHIYKCKMELLDASRLQIRGFLGISLLGRSQIWTRYTGTSMMLPPAH